MRDSESIAQRIADEVASLTEADDVTIAVATRDLFIPFPGELGTWHAAISGKDGSIVRVTITAFVAEKDIR